MVLFYLLLKAELENVGRISMKKDAKLRIDVGNPLNDFETRDKVVVDPSELVESEDSKIPAYHFGISWEGGGGKKKVSTLTIKKPEEIKTWLKKNKKKGVDPPRDYTADDAGQWVPLAAVECRGLEPRAFHPMGDEFVVYSNSNGGEKEFAEDVDLGEGDWADYDEDADEPVSLSDIEFKWESV